MYTTVMAEKVVSFFVRLTPGLHTQLVERARRDNRSLNNLVVTWLQRGLSEGW